MAHLSTLFHLPEKFNYTSGPVFFGALPGKKLSSVQARSTVIPACSIGSVSLVSAASSTMIVCASSMPLIL
jgi:hypothetical protein